ncbi:IPT/TIG domain-containing protein [bacterium]|nr:IPT/TIG domain-containing protein [bacterium]
MSHFRLLTALVLSASLLAACKAPASLSLSPGLGLSAPAAQGSGATIQRDPRVLSGVIEFPVARTTQASAAEVINAASLQLIDVATGMTITTGVTGNTGAAAQNFSLSLPVTYTPTPGQVFTIQAVKGLGSNGLGNTAVRLRTYLQWTNAGWTSTTGSSTIALTAMTTALCLLSQIDPANVTPASTIGKVAYAGGVSTYSGPVTGHTAPEVNNLTASVTAALGGDVDPVATITRIQPVVTGLSSVRGATGELVAVFGDGFSPVSGAATVSFNGAPAGTFMARGRTTLYVLVPDGATTGNVTVTTVNGTSNGFPFTVINPGYTVNTAVITGLNRSVLRVGDSLTITGRNFDPVPANNLVTLNALNLPVTGGSATHLTLTVPPGAASGPVKITNSNGVSGAHYLGIISSGPKSLVETFTDAATRDASTTLTWSNTKTLDMPDVVRWRQEGMDFAAQSGTSFVNTFSGTYPKGGGVGLVRSVNSNNFVEMETHRNAALTAYQSLATNGEVLLALDTGGTLRLYKNKEGSQLNQEYQVNDLGLPFVSEARANETAGLAGFPGSNIFYYLPTGIASTDKLYTLVLTNYGITRGPVVQLPFLINKYASNATYGFRIGSNGTRLLIWGGTAPSPTPNITTAANIYEFIVNGFATPTYVRASSMVSWAQPADTRDYQTFTGDDRYYYLAYPSTYYYHQMVVQSDATRPYTTVPFYINAGAYGSGNNNASVCYDMKNDCYWVWHPSAGMLSKNVSSGAVFSNARGTHHVTSPLISLPSGQAWDTLSTGVVLPYQSAIKVQILNSANAVLYTLAPEDLGKTVSVKDALAAHTGQIKLRAYLETGDTTKSPFLMNWGVTSAWKGGTAIAQSKEYDTGAGNEAVQYLSYTMDQPTGAPLANVEFSDSADKANWSPWTTQVQTLSKRYVRWRIVMPSQNFSGTLATRLQIDYQY